MTQPIAQKLARMVVETVGAHGTPPEWGFQLFTVGLDGLLDLVDEEYLADYLKTGGSAFKMVVGSYGGGKTHLLYCLRERAWARGFAVAYVPLSAEESPFHKLDRVYRAVVLNLMTPVSAEELLSGVERGIAAVITRWYQAALAELTERGLADEALLAGLEAVAADATRDLESSNVQAALRLAFQSLARGRTADFDAAIAYLTVEGFEPARHKPLGILRPIDRSNALGCLRSLARWIANLGHAGLVVLFDEAEQVPSLSSKQRDLMLSNLRELIDECGHASLRSTLIVYAIPDDSVFDGATAVYEALRQRIVPVFDFYNPSGVKIRLESLWTDPVATLVAAGRRLRDVYESAYGVELPPAASDEAVALLARVAYDQRFGDIGYRRLFVQAAVRAFHWLRRKPDFAPRPDWALTLVDGGPPPPPSHPPAEPDDEADPQG